MCEVCEETMSDKKEVGMKGGAKESGEDSH